MLSFILGLIGGGASIIGNVELIVLLSLNIVLGDSRMVCESVAKGTHSKCSEMATILPSVNKVLGSTSELFLSSEDGALVFLGLGTGFDEEGTLVMLFPSAVSCVVVTCAHKIMASTHNAIY